jgi:hypothetical protein
MTTEESENPYATPDGNGDSSTARKPGLLATLMVAIASVFAGFCAWYGTCTGLVSVGYLGPGIVSSVAMLMGFVLCIPVGVFVSRWTRRTLLAMLEQQGDTDRHGI